MTHLNGLEVNNLRGRAKPAGGQNEEQIAARELINYEYMVVDTPRFTIAREEWQLYDIFPAKWNPGNMILVFRREVKPPTQPSPTKVKHD